MTSQREREIECLQKEIKFTRQAVASLKKQLDEQNIEAASVAARAAEDRIRLIQSKRRDVNKEAELIKSKLVSSDLRDIENVKAPTLANRIESGRLVKDI